MSTQGAGTSGAGDVFATTHWTVVWEATRSETPGAQRALEEVCRTYWFPLYAYVRRRGHARADAEDLTQEFFRQLLERRWLEDVDREKGRLRAFLITALKRFLSKEWRRASARKRGGDRAHVPMDTQFAESRYAAEIAGPDLEADAVFDRQWALAVLDRSMRRLEGEYVADGRGKEFEVLKQCLVVTRGSVDYAAVSQALGTQEGTARVAVHRVRRRFREVYREEVAWTLPPGTDLKEELHYLARCLLRA